MLIILILLDLIGLGTLIAEVWTGIAVTGWQGEKPYIKRMEQPYHYWFVLVIHFLVGVILPSWLAIRLL